MTSQNQSALLIIGLIIVGALLYQYGNFFGISLTSPTIQYYNEPIVAEFTTTNFTNPDFFFYFNDEEIDLDVINWSAEELPIYYVFAVENGTNVVKVYEIEEEGTLKIVASENNITETKTINVQQPYVKVGHNIPNTAEEKDSLKIIISTTTPQGDLLVADSVIIEITNPENEVKTLTLTKSGDDYETNYIYDTDGTYQFKIRASKQDYKIKEYSAVTTVIETGGIHPVIWVWIGAILLWVILFGIKFARTR